MSNWITLVPCPNGLSSQICPLSKTEFVAATRLVVRTLPRIRRRRLTRHITFRGGLYKYNVNDCKWIKIIDYNKLNKAFSQFSSTITFDESNHQLMYICKQHQLLEFSLNSKSI
eukprot:UN10348